MIQKNVRGFFACKQVAHIRAQHLAATMLQRHVDWVRVSVGHCEHTHCHDMYVTIYVSICVSTYV